MATIHTINPTDDKEIELQEESRIKLEELAKKHFKGTLRMEKSKFYQEEFALVVDGNQIACFNFNHHEIGVSTASLPNWLIEMIVELEDADHNVFSVYVNNG